MPIRPGNTKLGPLIHHWSIPAAVRAICIGATALCLKLCYAIHGHFNQTNVKNALAANYVESLEADFVQRVNSWLYALYVRILRVHASGEFYSAEYTDKWIEIAKQNQRVLFFAYTRSWSDPTVLARLCEYAKLPNVVLWFSCDRESGPPPEVPEVRRAFLMTDDNDIPAYDVDLVFRDKDTTVLKWVGSALVCPAENGVTKMTCSRCQLCFRDKPLPSRKTHDSRCISALPVLQQRYNLQTTSRGLQTVDSTYDTRARSLS
jgi:hypothetical protein